jgi:hypothetical protein
MPDMNDTGQHMDRAKRSLEGNVRTIIIIMSNNFCPSKIIGVISAEGAGSVHAYTEDKHGWTR